MDRPLKMAVCSAVIITLAVIYFLSPKAHCSWCESKGKQCYSSFDCGMGCQCYKGGHIYGECGPR